MVGLDRLVGSLAAAIGLGGRPWAAPALLIAAIVLLYPWIRDNLRTGDARKLLKHASRERGEERERLEERAFALVKGKPDGLVVVAEEAIEQGRTALAARAVAELRLTKKRLPKLRLLERKLEPPLPILASEAAIHIEALIESGVFVTARERLALARRRWPNDEELRALEPRLAAAAPADPPIYNT